MSRNAAIFLVVVLAVLLSALGAQAYSVRLSGFPGITQDNCSMYCGAASCKMCCQWVDSCTAAQSTIYTYCNSNNMEAWYIDPQGLSWGMWYWTPADPMHLYGHWHYGYATGAIRGICWTIDLYEEAVPVVIRTGAHWVVVRGFSSTMSVYSNYSYNGGTLVNGVYVNDPLYSACGGYIGAWDSYFSASTFASSYFNNIGGGGHFTTRCSTERDGTTQNACRTNNDSFAYY